MFLLIQGVRSAAARLLAARLQAKADALAEKVVAAGQAVAKLPEKATPDQVMAQFEARAKMKAAEAQWEPVAAKAEKWLARRDRAVTPTSRVPAYLAGKLDAALLAVVAYPYVPVVVDVVRKYLG